MRIAIRYCIADLRNDYLTSSGLLKRVNSYDPSDSIVMATVSLGCRLIQVRGPVYAMSCGA